MRLAFGGTAFLNGNTEKFMTKNRSGGKILVYIKREGTGSSWEIPTA